MVSEPLRSPREDANEACRATTRLELPRTAQFRCSRTRPRVMPPEDPSYRVVGFRVETTSVDKGSYEFGQGGGCTIKDNANHQEITDNTENK